MKIIIAGRGSPSSAWLKPLFGALLIFLLSVSCAETSYMLLEDENPEFSINPEDEIPDQEIEITEEAPEIPEAIEEIPEVIQAEPVIPPAPEYILGQGLTRAQYLSDFLLLNNPDAGDEFSGELAELYVEEAAAEGINHDTAFAQMCLETGFLRYGGLVTPEMNNFCGLGATGPEQRGEEFPDKRTGVRAHIQHLKAYATEEPLNQELVDPRFFYVRYGSSPKISGLAGTWAADRQYAEKIKAILERLYEFSFKEKEMENLADTEDQSSDSDCSGDDLTIQPLENR